MKVSVIIPCCNSELHLAATLQSLVDQTWRGFEVIAIDDFSTDGTLKILLEFQARLNLHIVTPKNPVRCAAASRNLGYAQCTGDYIKFLDSDDILSADQLEKQWNALQGRLIDSVAVSGWSRFYNQPAENPVQHIEPLVSLPPSEWILRSIEAGHSMMQCGMFLLPRPLLNQVGLWRPEPAPTDDFEFFIRLLLASKQVIPTGGVLWYRSWQTGSLSRQTDAIHAHNAANRVTEALERLLAATDCTRAKPLAGRIYFDWACTFYPQHPQISYRLEMKARDCGVRQWEVDGGKLLRFCSRAVGWKLARRLQYYIYKLGYLHHSIHRLQHPVHLA